MMGDKRCSNKERQDNKRLFKDRGHLTDTNPFIFTEALSQGSYIVSDDADEHTFNLT